MNSKVRMVNLSYLPPSSCLLVMVKQMVPVIDFGENSCSKMVYQHYLDEDSAIMKQRSALAHTMRLELYSSA